MQKCATNVRDLALASNGVATLRKRILEIERNASQFKLEGKRERSYPSTLKVSKNATQWPKVKIPLTLSERH